MSKNKIIPISNRVLIEPLDQHKEDYKKTDTGLYITGSSHEERPEKGKVIAIGEGLYENGKLIPMKIKVGDLVIFSKYGYDEIKIDDKKYLILKEENILAIIK